MMEVLLTPQSGGVTAPLGHAQSPFDYSPSTTRRKHVPLTSASSTLSDVPEQEIAALRRQRRHSRVMELQKQLQSPGGTPDRTRSPLTSRSNSQITEHYTNCIKLSAENKINAKNAFGLHLIEYMSDLLRSKKGETTNFQVASCTLDASTKIYAGRVDAIHAETYKMLGGLGHGDKEGSKDDDHVEGEEGTTTNSKKKQRHSKTIETNLKNINVKKFDRGFEVDPLFEKTSASFDEGGTFGLLLHHHQVRDDTCELLLDSNIILDEKSDGKAETEEAMEIDLTEIREIFSGKFVEGLSIFSHFDDFEFSKITDEVETFKTAMGHKEDQNAFDMAAVPEPLDIEEPLCAPTDQYDDYDDNDDVGGGEMGDESVFMGDSQEARVVSGFSSCSSMSGTVSELCRQLSMQPTEYSYFDLAAVDNWAGPQHWKLKAKPQEVKKGARNKKPVFRIDYSETKVFDQHFKETRAATTISKSTSNKYDQQTNILPDDIHYNPDDLFRPSHKPAFTVRVTASTTEVSVDEDVGGYDYQNENDCANFCPDAGGEDDADDSCGFSADQTTLASQEISSDSVFNATAFQGDNLVVQPHKVNKIDIAYARTAKKMDVKKLKTVMWSHLTHPPEENKENLEIISDGPEKEKEGVAGKQTFTDLYGALPSRLSGTMAKNLSIPIAFVCLLHLANEKCLMIKSSDDLDELYITQDSP